MSDPVSPECRPAALPDLPGLLSVMREFYGHFGFPWDAPRKAELVQRLMESPDLGSVWVWVDSGRVCGYALVAHYFSVEFDGRVALLDELFVLPEGRGKGVGSRMVDRISRALEEAGIRTLRLEVDRRHPEAASLYARLGFVPDGREAWTLRRGS